jgi:hypothetical protein
VQKAIRALVLGVVALAGATAPLSRWAKLLMMFESALSTLAVLLVAARAVNIFK